MPALLAMLDPQVVWIEPAGAPYGGTYFGRDAVLERVIVRLTSNFDNYKVAPYEYIDVGNKVIVLGAISGTSRTTGTDLRSPYTAIVTVRDGKVVKYECMVDTALFAEAMQ